MYATAGEFLGYNKDETYSASQDLKHVRSKKAHIKESYEEIKPKQDTNVQMKTSHFATSNPKVWGPPFWYTLHVSAAHYPLEASPLVKERMKGRILSIPYEIPCPTCRDHASAFVEKHRDTLDKIVSGKHDLGKFYVDFHNAVNKRYGKPEWSYKQAYDYYSTNATL